jgi:hypothetical protein
VGPDPLRPAVPSARAAGGAAAAHVVTQRAQIRTLGSTPPTYDSRDYAPPHRFGNWFQWPACWRERRPVPRPSAGVAPLGRDDLG